MHVTRITESITELCISKIGINIKIHVNAYSKGVHDLAFKRPGTRIEMSNVQDNL